MEQTGEPMTLRQRLSQPIQLPRIGPLWKVVADLFRTLFDRPYATPLVYLVLLAAVVSRRPDLVARGQFYAEDGTIFFAEAQERGFFSMLTPYNGYLHAVPRLIANIAERFPLESAPSVMNFLSLSIVALAAAYPIARFKSQPLSSRILLALAVIAVPRVYEAFGNTANLQWYLAVLGCFIVGSDPPKSRSGGVFDAVALVLIGLSGPLVIPLALLAAWRLRRERNWRQLGIAVFTMLPALIQIGVMVAFPRERYATSGLSPGLLVDILYAQIGGTLLGNVRLMVLFEFLSIATMKVLTLAVIAGFMAYAFRHGPKTIRYLIIMGAVCALAGYLRPVRDGLAKEFILDHLRYFYILHAAALASVLWTCARFSAQRRRTKLVIAGCSILVLVPNLRVAWNLTPSVNLFHRDQVEQARRSHVTRTDLYILPPGWKVNVRVR